MMLMRDLVYPKPSYPQVGKFFHGMHHTTVLHSIRKMRLAVVYDPKLQEIADRVRGGKPESQVDYFDRKIAHLKADITRRSDDWQDRLLDLMEERAMAIQKSGVEG